MDITKSNPDAAIKYVPSSIIKVFINRINKNKTHTARIWDYYEDPINKWSEEKIHVLRKDDFDTLYFKNIVGRFTIIKDAGDKIETKIIINK